MKIELEPEDLETIIPALQKHKVTIDHPSDAQVDYINFMINWFQWMLADGGSLVYEKPVREQN